MPTLCNTLPYELHITCPSDILLPVFPFGFRSKFNFARTFRFSVLKPLTSALCTCELGVEDGISSLFIFQHMYIKLQDLIGRHLKGLQKALHNCLCSVEGGSSQRGQFPVCCLMF